MDYLIERIESYDKASEERRAQAARQIQQFWRKRNAAKANKLNADQRWEDAATHAKLKVTCSMPIQNSHDLIAHRLVVRPPNEARIGLMKDGNEASSLPADYRIVINYWIRRVCWIPGHLRNISRHNTGWNLSMGK
jgi:hypothetical protein